MAPSDDPKATQKAEKRLLKAAKRERRRQKKAKKPKNFFVRGLVVLLPTVLTIFIFATVVQFVNVYLTKPINGAIVTLLDSNALGWQALEMMDVDPRSRTYVDLEELPDDLQLRLGPGRELGTLDRPEAITAIENYREPRYTFIRDFGSLAIDREKLRDAVPVPQWVGLVIAAVIVLILGYLASGFLGRSLIAGFDRALTRIPLVRSVYPYTKQLVDFFLSDNELEFDTVVAAPYPSEGVWAIGFVTGGGLKTVHEELGGAFLSVFIPTSPMPMTGFTVFIEADRLIPLDITVDEALRVTVSAGVLVPANEQVGELDEAHERWQRLGLETPPANATGGEAEAFEDERDGGEEKA
ncbi:MAG: DUF502 domain-containing protein [Planctomycetota bacterium]